MSGRIEVGLDGGVDVDLRHATPPVSARRNRSVPFVDLPRSNESLFDEILAAWEGILRTGQFTGGQEVEAFEAEFAEFVGAEECVAVGSGTDALILSLRAMGIQPGNEVITVPHTFIATAQAIVEVGGNPRFVDVDPLTATMDPERLEAAVSPTTRAVLPVHLYGHPADMDPIREICDRYGLQLLEDACQAHGARYHGERIGSTGTVAFSFYPSKNLGGCGQGGAVTTSDPRVAERLRRLRNHGETERYIHPEGGINSRLDALQAAALRIKLRQLDDWVAARQRWASSYDRLLATSGLELPATRAGSTHAYHLYVVRHPARDRLKSQLAEAGIDTGLHYPVPLHLQGAFRHLGIPPGRFPTAERWADQGLSLPMYPELTEEAVVHVADSVADALERQRVSARHPA